MTLQRDPRAGGGRPDSPPPTLDRIWRIRVEFEYFRVEGHFIRLVWYKKECLYHGRNFYFIVPLSARAEVSEPRREREAQTSFVRYELCRRVYLLPRVCAEPYAPCKEWGVN